MKETNDEPASPWGALRKFTPARVALGRAGGSLPTAALLDFRLGHARARDALIHSVDEEKLVRALEAASRSDVLRLHSIASGLTEYLQRPDLGRLLSPESVQTLEPLSAARYDLVVVVSEGLSGLAVEAHASAVIGELFPRLLADHWRIAPVCFVRRARVALQDHAGEVIGASYALILLGERPGLLAPDSLGGYVVRTPKRGNTDAQRNCISNISRLGLTPRRAADRLHWLLSEARRRGLTGVELKFEEGRQDVEATHRQIEASALDLPPCA